MGRKKLYTTKIEFRTTTELKETFFAAMNAVGKDKFQNDLLQFCNQLLTSNNVVQNNNVRQNNENNVVQNNNVRQNNEDNVVQNMPKPVEDWTQEDINDLLGFEDKLQDAVNKNFKPVKRNKKELSDFEIEQLLVDSDNSNSLESLF